jgi:pimeloyl-ACP methyl ester carboxylesterase
MASKLININNQSYNIVYDIQNISAKKTIVFLHGWGSNKEVMKQSFQNELKEYKHIYIDMPGFGKSINEDYILTTHEYANIIKEFLNTLNISADIIAGHSFGGKVATLLNPPLLVLLSSAGIIEDKSAKTLLTIRMAKIFNKFGLGKVTKMLRSKDVNMMSQNMYETFKNVVDEDFSEVFKSYNGKALLFWGKKDTATTLKSGEIMHNLIKDSKFYAYDDDHYFFMKYHQDIASIIIKYNI